jgi:hypothetical protein
LLLGKKNYFWKKISFPLPNLLKMKSIFTTLLLVVGSVGSLFSQATPELLYYKFDGTGTSVPNLALTPPVGTTTATLMGGLTQGPTGQCQGAVIGTGVASSTDYVNTGWATNLTGTSWTISMYTADITPSTTLFYVFGDANAGSFRCFTNGVANPGNWILRGTGITDVLVTGGATVAPHVTTFVYDITTNTIYGYLDGVLVTSVAQPGPVINGAGPFKVIGYGTNVGAPSGGKLDEFRVYNRALTAAEVAQLVTPPDVYSSFSVISCGPYTVPSGDETYSVSGTYMDTIPAIADCGDSIMTITVNVAPNGSSFNASACASYTVPSGDETYFTSGVYYDTLPNMYGCDSVLTINVTLLNSIGIMSISGCASYTVPSGDETYYASGTYMDTIPNAAGCDSIMTITVFINNTTSTFSATGCGSYTVPSGDETYFASGTYMDTIPNAMSCDSIMTINVTLLNSASTFSATGCGSYTVPSGDETYMADGTYMDTIPNMMGCDSIMTITVTLLNSSSSFSASNCTSYTAPSGATFTTSGTYMDTIPNAMGCDSIMTINVTIHGLPTVAGSASSNTVCVDDAAVTLTGSPAGGTWSGTGVSGTSFSPSTAGTGTWVATYSYTDANSCSNSATTSILVNACVGVAEQTLLNGVNVYPNPNNGVFTLAVNANVGDMQIVITDLQGRVVYSSNENNVNAGYTQQINLQSEAAGMYLMQITANGQQRVDKISVQK